MAMQWYADELEELVLGSIETIQEPASERQHHNPVDKLLVWVKAGVEFPVQLCITTHLLLRAA